MQINCSLEMLYILLLQIYNSSTYRYKKKILSKLDLSDSFVPANVNSGKISLALEICIAHEEFRPKM